MRSVRRLLLLLLAPVVLVLAGTSVASAHTGTTAVAASEGRTQITWSFAHGCNGKPTVGLRVKLPDGAWNVSPSSPAGWSAAVTATEVHWTGPAIADGTTASFTAVMVLVQPAGSTVTMPTVQECTDGAEIAWIEAPSSSDGTESTHPAPTIVVPANSTLPPSTTTAAPSTTTSSVAMTSTSRMITGSSAITDNGSPTSTSGVIVFAGVCAVIAIGAAVLFLRHRRSTKD